MSPRSVVLLALMLSIWSIVLSVGARATVEDALYFLRRPALLLRALLAVFVIVPAFALFMSSAFSLGPEIKFALVALSVGPVPPILPLKQLKAGARGRQAVGLLVALAVASILVTPLLVEFSSRVLRVEAAISAEAVARTVAVSIGLPLGVGMALRGAWPRTAEAVAKVARAVGSILLLLGVAVLIVVNWGPMTGLVGNGAIVAIAATVLVGLIAGHLLGGGRDGDSTALALAAATRHPGVAMAIATANFPERLPTVFAAVLLFLLVNAAVTAVYVMGLRRRVGATAPAAPSTDARARP